MPTQPPHLPARLVAHPRWWWLVCMGWAVTAPAWAQGSIYTCTDAKGRRLTSDRPIPECLDREQRELRPSGSLKRVVPPSYTAQEQAEVEAKHKAEAVQAAKLAEDKRRERALVSRYPDQASHDQARAEAIGLVQEQIVSLQQRGLALAKQRQSIDAEFEFYAREPHKAPARLKKQRDDNQRQQTEVQHRLAEQAQAKQAAEQRFDEELAHLRQLWAPAGHTPR